MGAIIGIVNTLILAIINAISFVFFLGIEAFLIFDNPRYVDVLNEYWVSSLGLYLFVVFVMMFSYYVVMMLLADTDDANVKRIVQRLIVSGVLLAISRETFGFFVALINELTLAILPESYSLWVQVRLLEQLVTSVGLGFAGLILALVGGSGILLSGVLLYLALAARMLIVYVAYAITPVLLGLWVVDVGPGKYANQISSLFFKAAAMLLVSGIVIAGVLSVGAAYGSSSAVSYGSGAASAADVQSADGTVIKSTGDWAAPTQNINTETTGTAVQSQTVNELAISLFGFVGQLLIVISVIGGLLISVVMGGGRTPTSGSSGTKQSSYSAARSGNQTSGSQLVQETDDGGVVVANPAGGGVYLDTDASEDEDSWTPFSPGENPLVDQPASQTGMNSDADTVPQQPAGSLHDDTSNRQIEAEGQSALALGENPDIAREAAGGAPQQPTPSSQSGTGGSSPSGEKHGPFQDGGMYESPSRQAGDSDGDTDTPTSVPTDTGEFVFGNGENGEIETAGSDGGESGTAGTEASDTGGFVFGSGGTESPQPSTTGDPTTGGPTTDDPTTGGPTTDTTTGPEVGPSNGPDVETKHSPSGGAGGENSPQTGTDSAADSAGSGDLANFDEYMEESGLDDYIGKSNADGGDTPIEGSDSTDAPQWPAKGEPITDTDASAYSIEVNKQNKQRWLGDYYLDGSAGGQSPYEKAVKNRSADAIEDGFGLVDRVPTESSKLRAENVDSEELQQALLDEGEDIGIDIGHEIRSAEDVADSQTLPDRLEQGVASEDSTETVTSSEMVGLAQMRPGSQIEDARQELDEAIEVTESRGESPAELSVLEQTRSRLDKLESTDSATETRLASCIHAKNLARTHGRASER